MTVQRRQHQPTGAKAPLAECRAGNIDVVLVYKIDRLSRGSATSLS